MTGMLIRDPVAEQIIADERCKTLSEQRKNALRKELLKVQLCYLQIPADIDTQGCTTLGDLQCKATPDSLEQSYVDHVLIYGDRLSESYWRYRVPNHDRIVRATRTAHPHRMSHEIVDIQLANMGLEFNDTLPEETLHKIMRSLMRAVDMSIKAAISF